MAEALPSERRSQVAIWLRAGKSTGEIQRAAKEAGWTVGRATVQKIKDQDLKPGEVVEDPQRKVKRLVEELAAAPAPAAPAAEPLDLVAFLTTQLRNAEIVSQSDGLSVRDRGIALKVVTDLAKLLRNEQESERKRASSHVVVFYHPEKVELHRLEMPE